MDRQLRASRLAAVWHQVAPCDLQCRFDLAMYSRTEHVHCIGTPPVGPLLGLPPAARRSSPSLGCRLPARTRRASLNTRRRSSSAPQAIGFRAPSGGSTTRQPSSQHGCHEAHRRRGDRHAGDRSAPRCGLTGAPDSLGGGELALPIGFRQSGAMAGLDSAQRGTDGQLLRTYTKLVWMRRR